MGMSTNTVGIIPADEKWKEMKLIYDTCLKNKIEIPKKVNEFFNDEEPDEKGVKIYLKYEKWDDGDMCSGVEI